AETSWPPADGTLREIPLDALRHHTRSWSGPQTIGLHAPAWDRAGTGSTDSSEDDARSISFETPPLEETLEILGTPEVEVAVTSSAAVGMIAARLSAVSPDGVGYLITRGSRNLVFPDDLSHPVPVTPGRPMTVRFPLMATSAVVQPAWRLRLALAGADFPVVWPPSAAFTLDVDPGRSRLLLPTIPLRDDATILSIPASPPPPSPPGLVDEDRGHTRLLRDGATVTYQRHRYSHQRQPERAGLSYTSDETWSISVSEDEPTSTRVRSDGVVTMERAGWKVATRGSLQLTADDSSFRLVIVLGADHDDRVVFTRTWDETIPREWA
ncbi:MAG TPA: CocE/NonD family hydrolase C-terminal non-catalytic domain-containing protein, partial [Acidimicrobiia bacterium]|nr:CocE/NonD family hydrolase C-terminal non-catalytic domain-containing protein [Acidimicrobiia bacterium]